MQMDYRIPSLTATDEIELTCFYMTMVSVSKNAPPVKIAAGFPESELHTLFENARKTLQTLSTDRNWLRS
jgi:hypothetical protein